MGTSLAARSQACQRQECQCSIDSCHAPRRRPLPRLDRRLRPLGPGPGLLLGHRRRRGAALRVLDLLGRRRPGADDDRLRDRPPGRPRGARPRRRRSSSPATPRSSTRRPPRSTDALRAAAARGARVDLGLHRRLRPRPRRPARRPPGRDPLGLGRGRSRRASRGRGRPRRALRRRGRGDDLGRAQRRHRPLPARDPQGLRRRGRRAGRAPHGRAAAPRGRPGPVHRAGRPPRTRPARWSRPGAGRPSASPSRSTSPRWPATPRVSPRTFARRFREETGTTPLQWLLARRVLEARRLLEETDLPVDEVAWRCGFGTAACLRDHFRRATATTPTAYRRLQPSRAGASR